MKLSSKGTNTHIQILPFLTKVYVHQIFFLLRSVCFCLLAFETKFFSEKIIPYGEVVEDIVFLSAFSLFTLGFIIRAIVTHNIFAYDLSIVLIFHNAIYICLIEFTVAHYVWDTHILYVILLIVLYFLEAFYSLFIRYINRNDINMFLFKKIGANPIINGKCKVY